MLLRLKRYDFDLKYVAGSNLILADTLSRAPELHSGKKRWWVGNLAEDQQSDLQLIASQQTINELRTAAADDPVYQRLKQQIIAGCMAANEVLVLPELQAYFTFSDELAVGGDFVFKGHRVVIPVGYREQISARLHSSHIGVNSCIRRARETCYFPGITAEIKRLISACPVCARIQTELQKEPLL